MTACTKCGAPVTNRHKKNKNRVLVSGEWDHIDCAPDAAERRERREHREAVRLAVIKDGAIT